LRILAVADGDASVSAGARFDDALQQRVRPRALGADGLEALRDTVADADPGCRK